MGDSTQKVATGLLHETPTGAGQARRKTTENPLGLTAEGVFCSPGQPVGRNLGER